MYSPNPVPVSDLVANLVNNRGNISESIPEPVSLTLTTATSLLFYFIFSSVTLILASLVNLIALLNILSKT